MKNGEKEELDENKGILSKRSPLKFFYISLCSFYSTLGNF